jgi:hypothetical protein
MPSTTERSARSSRRSGPESSGCARVPARDDVGAERAAQAPARRRQHRPHADARQLRLHAAGQRRLLRPVQPPSRCARGACGSRLRVPGALAVPQQRQHQLLAAAAHREARLAHARAHAAAAPSMRFGEHVHVAAHARQRGVDPQRRAQLRVPLRIEHHVARQRRAGELRPPNSSIHAIGRPLRRRGRELAPCRRTGDQASTASVAGAPLRIAARAAAPRRARGRSCRRWRASRRDCCSCRLPRSARRRRVPPRARATPPAAPRRRAAAQRGAQAARLAGSRGAVPARRRRHAPAPRRAGGPSPAGPPSRTVQGSGRRGRTTPGGGCQPSARALAWPSTEEGPASRPARRAAPAPGPRNASAHRTPSAGRASARSSVAPAPGRLRLMSAEPCPRVGAMLPLGFRLQAGARSCSRPLPAFASQLPLELAFQHARRWCAARSSPSDRVSPLQRPAPAARARPWRAAAGRRRCAGHGTRAAACSDSSNATCVPLPPASADR